MAGRVRGLIGWVVVVPVLAALTTWFASFDGFRLLLTLLLLAALLGAARVSLGSTEHGLGWRILTILCALAVTVPTVAGTMSVLALAGERVTAVVSEEISVTERRLADPATGEDLGLLPGTARVTGAGEVGDPIDVLVLPGSGLDPLPASRAGIGTTFATVWAAGWVAGLVLVLVRSRRPVPA